MNEIRRAKIEDRPALQEFFNEFWGLKHCIINTREFFDYYILNGKDLNFYIAEDDGKIVSACAYNLASHSAAPFAWTTLWLTRPDIKSGIGLKIMDHLSKNAGFSAIGSLGCKKNTLGLYKFLGFHTGRMEHFYRLAENIPFKIAKIEDRKILPAERTSSKLILLNTPEQLKSTFDAAALEGKNPYKDLDYIIKRYYYFPFYRYFVYGVKTNGSCRTLVVIREEYCRGASILRIVDVIGDHTGIAGIGGEIDALMAFFGSEYTDIYCYGLDRQILTSAGFCDRYETENIIPDHFYPFDQSNIDYYFFTSMPEGFSMFKADGDQDHIYLDIL